MMMRHCDVMSWTPRIDDSTWNALLDRNGKRFAMDLVHASGHFMMIFWGLIATAVEVEPHFDQFSKNRAKLTPKGY